MHGGSDFPPHAEEDLMRVQFSLYSKCEPVLARSWRGKALNFGKPIFRMTTVGAVFFLTGCLVSEIALLDASNGRATPLRTGEYQSCPYKDGEMDGECTAVRVTYEKSSGYRIVDDNGEALLVRFRKVARRAYLAQTVGEGDEDGYMYFMAEPDHDNLHMTMIVCEALPEALKTKLVADGQMEIESGGEVCSVKTLDAALAAAKIYLGDDAPSNRIGLEFSPVTQTPE